MRLNKLLFIPLLLMICAKAAAADNAKQPYLIQAGDILEISVWKEEGLQKEVIVRPDGTISFPLVNQLDAAKHTVNELQSQLEKELSKYIPDPVVTVDVRQLLGNKIYVIGKVNKPGAFTAPSYIDVVQALSIAGGMTPYAAVDKIKILRRENGKLRSIPFEYGDIEKGENLDQDIVLRPGDVIVVP